MAESFLNVVRDRLVSERNQLISHSELLLEKLKAVDELKNDIRIRERIVDALFTLLRELGGATDEMKADDSEPDPRVSLTLSDMKKPYADDPKVALPLVKSSS
jgi:hypothetical protein